jgi:hypothetical protein
MLSFIEYLVESDLQMHSFGQAYHNAMAARYEADSEIFRADASVGKGIGPRDEEQWDVVNKRAKFHRGRADQHGERVHGLMGDTPVEFHIKNRAEFFGNLAATKPGHHTDPEYEFSDKKARDLEKKERTPALRDILS